MNNHRQKLIYLVGFMGAGKSSVGTLLAQHLGWPFVDLDTIIEAGQGATIREIFEQAGEPFFRRIEHAALVEVARKEPAVIALGGGTFTQKANFDLIRQGRGVTIWLDCPVEELWERCCTMDNRPLFRDRESFSKLHEQRVSYYRQAEFRVATAGRQPEDIAEEIILLKLFS
ncbi:MAG TPA: shikimate kinase [Terriglobia bacterium]|nr:shikimate kinase [Terriglobia bacterium]